MSSASSPSLRTVPGYPSDWSATTADGTNLAYVNDQGAYQLWLPLAMAADSAVAIAGRTRLLRTQPEPLLSATASSWLLAAPQRDRGAHHAGWPTPGAQWHFGAAATPAPLQVLSVRYRQQLPLGDGSWAAAAPSPDWLWWCDDARMSVGAAERCLVALRQRRDAELPAAGLALWLPAVSTAEPHFAKEAVRRRAVLQQSAWSLGFRIFHAPPDMADDQALGRQLELTMQGQLPTEMLRVQALPLARYADQTYSVAISQDGWLRDPTLRLGVVQDASAQDVLAEELFANDLSAQDQRAQLTAFDLQGSPEQGPAIATAWLAVGRDGAHWQVLRDGEAIPEQDIQIRHGWPNLSELDDDGRDPGGAYWVPTVARPDRSRARRWQWLRDNAPRDVNTVHRLHGSLWPLWRQPPPTGTLAWLPEPEHWSQLDRLIAVWQRRLAELDARVRPVLVLPPQQDRRHPRSRRRLPPPIGPFMCNSTATTGLNGHNCVSLVLSVIGERDGSARRVPIGGFMVVMLTSLAPGTASPCGA